MCICVQSETQYVQSNSLYLQENQKLTMRKCWLHFDIPSNFPEGPHFLQYVNPVTPNNVRWSQKWPREAVNDNSVTETLGNYQVLPKTIWYQQSLPKFEDMSVERILETPFYPSILVYNQNIWVLCWKFYHIKAVKYDK